MTSLATSILLRPVLSCPHIEPDASNTNTDTLSSLALSAAFSTALSTALSAALSEGLYKAAVSKPQKRYLFIMLSLMLLALFCRLRLMVNLERTWKVVQRDKSNGKHSNLSTVKIMSLISLKNNYVFP